MHGDLWVGRCDCNRIAHFFRAGGSATGDQYLTSFFASLGVAGLVKMESGMFLLNSTES